MTVLAAAGGEEFLLGFRLAGVRNIFNTEENPKETLEALMREEDIGIVVIDEKTLEGLPEHFKGKINNSVEPVFVPLSEEAESSNLRQKIVRAIGIDLWEKGD